MFNYCAGGGLVIDVTGNVEGTRANIEKNSISFDDLK